MHEYGYNWGVPETTLPAAPALREKDLKQWRLIERFQEALAAETDQRGGLTGTWAHPQRRLEQSPYLSLFLFGLLNPVVETMRGLCAATELERVQREACPPLEGVRPAREPGQFQRGAGSRGPRVA